jgi:hypothetical protein
MSSIQSTSRARRSLNRSTSIPINTCWKSEEQDAVEQALWNFGVYSVNSNDAASTRVLQAPGEAVAAVPQRTSDEVNNYTRQFIWNLYSTFIFVSPLMHAAGVDGYKLNSAFLAELATTHPDLPHSVSSDTSWLLPSELRLPPAVNQIAGYSVAEAELKEHSILSRWISQLRRVMLVRELTASILTKDKLEGTDMMQQQSPLQLAESIILRCPTLQYDSQAATTLPKADWTAQQDAMLLLVAAQEGYSQVGKLSPAPLMLLRLDFILDHLYTYALQQQADQFGPNSSNVITTAKVITAEIAQSASNLPLTTPFPFPPALSNPIWTAHLIRSVVDVLCMHGLPVLSFDAAVAQSNIVTTSDSTILPIVTLPCPACPVLNWTALFDLLRQHTAFNFDDELRWQPAIASLLAHLSAEIDDLAVRSVGLTWRRTQMEDGISAFGALLPNGRKDISIDNSSLSSLVPVTSLVSLRRSLLFFHHLRVRILDASFHGFSSAEEVIEWISQYAPGLLTPHTSSQIGVTTGISAKTDIDLQIASVLESAVSSHSQGGDFGIGNSSMDIGSASMRPSSDSTTSSMPDWWQIGYHDYCLLHAINTWGMRNFNGLFEKINRDIKAQNNKKQHKTEPNSSDKPPLSHLHWNDSSVWRAHSRAIIRARMGDGPIPPPDGANTNDAPALEVTDAEVSIVNATGDLAVPATSVVDIMPAVSVILPSSYGSILRRVTQLIQPLAAIATDEFINRLLQCVEDGPISMDATTTVHNAISTTDASATMMVEGEGKEPQADIPVVVHPDTSTPHSTSSSSPALSFHLSAAGASSLHYFQSSLCCYSFQPELLSLLQTRWLEIAPADHPLVIQARADETATVPQGKPDTAGTLPTPFSLPSSSRKRKLGLHSSLVPLASVQAAMSTGEDVTLSLGPENPLKLSDAVYLSAGPSSLLGLRGANTFAGSSFSPYAIQTISAAGQFTSNNKRLKSENDISVTVDGDKQNQEVSADLAIFEEEVDSAQDGSVSSPLVSLVEGRRNAGQVSTLLRALCEQDSFLMDQLDEAANVYAEQLRLSLPSSSFIDVNAQLVTPQKIGEGIVLIQLGKLKSEHFALARHLTQQRRTKAKATTRTSPVARMENTSSEESSTGSISESISFLPVGYASVVRHQSYVDTKRFALYLCQIIDDSSSSSSYATAMTDDDNTPLSSLRFRVTASDDISHPIEATSPQCVWDGVSRRICATAFDASHGGQRQLTELDGWERFGLDAFTYPIVAHALLTELMAGDAQVQHALRAAFSEEELRAHVSILTPIQYYLASPADVSAAKQRQTKQMSTCLHSHWSHHWLRLQSVSRSVLAPHSVTETVVEAVHVQERAEAEAIAAAAAAAKAEAEQQASVVAAYANASLIQQQAAAQAVAATQAAHVAAYHQQLQQQQAALAQQQAHHQQQMIQQQQQQMVAQHAAQAQGQAVHVASGYPYASPTHAHYASPMQTAQQPGYPGIDPAAAHHLYMQQQQQQQLAYMQQAAAQQQQPQYIHPVVLGNGPSLG